MRSQLKPWLCLTHIFCHPHAHFCHAQFCHTHAHLPCTLLSRTRLSRFCYAVEVVLGRAAHQNMCKEHGFLSAPSPWARFCRTTHGNRMVLNPRSPTGTRRTTSIWWEPSRNPRLLATGWFAYAREPELNTRKAPGGSGERLAGLSANVSTNTSTNVSANASTNVSTNVSTIFLLLQAHL